MIGKIKRQIYVLLPTIARHGLSNQQFVRSPLLEAPSAVQPRSSDEEAHKQDLAGERRGQ